MIYTFKVKAHAAGAIYAESSQLAEIIADRMASQFIEGCIVADECPYRYEENYAVELLEHRVEVTAENGDKWHMNKYEIDLIYAFDWDFELASLSEAFEKVGQAAIDLFKGSKLEGKGIEVECSLSDQQEGLNDLLCDIQFSNEPFCIQSENELYHVECARQALGDKAVDEAILHGDNGDGVSMTTGREFAHEYREAFSNGEENYHHCVCLNSLFDVPPPFELVDNIVEQA